MAVSAFKECSRNVLTGMREGGEIDLSATCCVSFFYEVYDFTKLIQDTIHLEESKPLIKAAGTDITHWLDYDTREPKMAVCSVTNVVPHENGSLPAHPTHDARQCLGPNQLQMS